jgi:hypothetical protein
MKKQLSVRNILLQAWSCLTSKFVDLMELVTTQFFIIAGFAFCSLLILTLLRYFLVDHALFHGLFLQYSTKFVGWIVAMSMLITLFFWMIFPLMYEQNALEIVLQRKLSGFDVNNRFFSYNLAMLMYYPLVILGLILGIVPGILLAQRWKFVGLHILDHGSTIRQAFRASWKMTHGYSWFLVGISIIQWLVFLCVAPTIIVIVGAIIFNKIVDAIIYKQLHVDHDKDISTCVCEN